MRRLLAALAATTLTLGVAVAADFQSKKDWSAKIQADHRISKALCADDAYLRTCTGELTDPDSGEKAPLGSSDCSKSVSDTVAYMLADGSDGGAVGAYYNKLPANIGAGTQMDEYASDIAKQIGTSLMGALVGLGGELQRTPECDAKLMEAFKVSGN